MRLKQDQLIFSFFTILFNSFIGQQQVESIKSAQSTNQTELGVNNLKKIHIPLPPLDIQLQIVSKINDIKEQTKILLKEAEELKISAKLEFKQAVFE